MLSTGNQIINLHNCRIVLGRDALDQARLFLDNETKKGNRCFLLMDENTRYICLPLLQKHFRSWAGEFVVPAGEGSKTVEQAEKVWDWLFGKDAGRDDILVNLGGGVVTDLGGFVASAFKRGMKFINIPTTLVGQADAAIGGKTAVNLAGAKNQLGTFYQPGAVFITTEFLETLPVEQLRNGYAEIIKCAILAGEKKWKQVSSTTYLDVKDWLPLLKIAVEYKVSLVKKDPYDQKDRQALNFGHTLGHALEALSMTKYPPGLLHGEAVALGMLGELFISYRKGGICWDKLSGIYGYLHDNYPSNPFKEEDADEILDLIGKDKKNTAGEYRFSLLDDFGRPMLNTGCETEIIQKAIRFITKEH